MRKGRTETPRSRPNDKSPRSSFSEKPGQLNFAKIAPYQRPQYGPAEEELAHLPFKEHEVQSLAKQIGIDYEAEKDKYLWFLVQIVNLDLPPGWMREEDPSGAVYYHNPNENVSTAKHPMITKFRSLFNEILENEMIGKAKMIALKEKVQKLEQQEKDIQSPKKPMPIKNDKVKKLKAAAAVIALSTNLGNKGSKGDLLDKGLRPITDQPQGILDSEKAKERFDKVKNTLEKRRVVNEGKINQVDDLVKTEDILNVCKQHYVELYGLYHKAPPESMAHIEEFDLVDPMELIEAARLFNVRSTQSFLFWILRAYCGLPLPDYWSKMFDTNMHREIYYNSCYDVKISVRPCFFYILDLMNYVKQEAIRDKDSFLHFSNKMTLCDKLGRQYDVDFASMIKDMIEKPSGERKNYFTYHQKKDVIKDDAQKVTKKKRRDEFNPNFSDAHFIEIANQMGIDLNTEIHLLMAIEDFVRSREAVERWFFRQAPDGPAFWVNHEQQKAVNRYPYLKDLKLVIDEARSSSKADAEEAKKHMKAEFNLIKVLFRKYPEEMARKIVLEEARNFVEYFLKAKGDGYAINPNLENKGYNLTGLIKKIGTQLSKNDVMDLLFYCPFDFSEYISEDFLKSTEAYLLKKFRMKGGSGGAGLNADDIDGYDGHNISLNSDENNDSARKIKEKIEDSKKLLDLAANIKGLTLDPEKKREFMKLLIDFDQKYGDHDLVDALEDDITENLKDGAALAQTLAANLINKANKKDANGKDIPGSSGPALKNGLTGNNLLNTGANLGGLNNSGNGSVNNKSNTNLTGNNNNMSGINGSNNALNNSFNNNGTNINGLPRQETLNKNKKADGSPADDSFANSSGKLGGLSDPKKDKTVTISQGNKSSDSFTVGKSLSRQRTQPIDETDEISNASLGSVDEKDEQGRKSSRKKMSSKKLTIKEDELEGKDGDDVEGDSPQKRSKRARRKKHRKTGDPNNPDQGGEGGDNGEEYSEGEGSEYSDEGEGENGKKSSTGKRTTRLLPDDDEKMLFTNKRTQELLENLADLATGDGKRKSTKRGNHRKSMDSIRSARDGSGSPNGTEFVDYVRSHSQALDDHEVVYHEIIMENGEKKLVPITVRTKIDLLKQGSLKSDGRDPGSRSPANRFGHGSPKVAEGTPKRHKDLSSKKVAAEHQQQQASFNYQDENLPMIIGSSYKARGSNEPFYNSQEGGWDHDTIMDSLNRYNVDALDEAYYKEERRRLEQGGDHNADNSPFVPLHTHHTHMKPKISKYQEPQNPHQTYKTLEGGLQNLDTIKKKVVYEKTGKKGVWAHVELFDMDDNDDSQLEFHRRSNSDAMRPPLHRYFLDDQNRPVGDNTFYTPFRRANLSDKRFLEYMGYLNTLVFMKKLNTLITTFLIKQFSAMQQNALGIDFNPEDPVFRNVFKKRYAKLIKQLRENLLKKKEFIQNIYSKVFNSPDNAHAAVLQSLQTVKEPSHQRGNAHQQPNSPPNNQGLSVGSNIPDINHLQQSIGLSSKDKKGAALKSVKSEKGFKLPVLANNRRNSVDRFKVSRTTMKSATAINGDELFDDNKIRKTEGKEEDNAWNNSQYKPEEGHKVNKRANLGVLHQKEMEANILLRSLNDHDRDNYKYYWNLLGDPLKLEGSIILSKKDTPVGLQPYHVLLMGHRLGLQIQNVKEPDLAWIAYLALATKLPQEVETNLMITSPRQKMRFQKVCNMKTGEHPGDKYFKTVLIHHQMRRKILLENMDEEDQTRYVKAQAWVKLREEAGGIYYYNFLTKQKTINLPGDLREIMPKVTAISMKSEVKEKLRLINLIMVENDHLLALMKNKVT